MIKGFNLSKIGLVSLSFLLFLVLLLTSCATGNQNDSSYYTYWREWPSGDIETNDIKRLQEIVPFDIVLPEYLPEELADYHPDLKFSKELEFPSEISVTGFYWAIESHRRINFEEFVELDLELSGFLEPSPRTSHDILEIKDIKVLEENWLEPVSLGSQEIQTLFLYKWIIDDVYFRLYIYGYDQNEARKVAESMIR